jgi:cell shape-determining protein MreC
VSEATGAVVEAAQHTVAQPGLAATSVVAWTVMVVVLTTVVALVALGFYRTRRSSADERRYHEVMARVTDTEARFARGNEATLAELRGLRTDVQATRAELAEVKERLAGLERLLSQIG